jgi:trehalose 6-phosphate synthase
VLSPGAGAADELSHGALLADPLDTEALAETIAAALEMPAGERRTRLDALQARLREHDVHRWAESFLTSLHEASGGARAPLRMIRWGGLSPARSEVPRRAVERG